MWLKKVRKIEEKSRLLWRKGVTSSWKARVFIIGQDDYTFFVSKAERTLWWECVCLYRAVYVCIYVLRSSERSLSLSLNYNPTPNEFARDQRAENVTDSLQPVDDLRVEMFSFNAPAIIIIAIIPPSSSKMRRLKRIGFSTKRSKIRHAERVHGRV